MVFNPLQKKCTEILQSLESSGDSPPKPLRRFALQRWRFRTFLSVDSNSLGGNRFGVLQSLPFNWHSMNCDSHRYWSVLKSIGKHRKSVGVSQVHSPRRHSNTAEPRWILPRTGALKQLAIAIASQYQRLPVDAPASVCSINGLLNKQCVCLCVKHLSTVCIRMLGRLVN